MTEQRAAPGSVLNAGPKAPRQITASQMSALLRSAAFGDVVRILMRAPKHRHISLKSLEALVLPALANNQFLIARASREKGARTFSAGVALWASVSDGVHERLKHAANQRIKLAPDEWKSGPHLWLVDLVAPSVLAPAMLKDLDEKVARGRPMHAVVLSEGQGSRTLTIKELYAEIRKKLG